MSRESGLALNEILAIYDNGESAMSNRATVLAVLKGGLEALVLKGIKATNIRNLLSRPANDTPMITFTEARLPDMPLAPRPHSLVVNFNNVVFLRDAGIPQTTRIIHTHHPDDKHLIGPIDIPVDIDILVENLALCGLSLERLTRESYPSPLPPGELPLVFRVSSNKPNDNNYTIIPPEGRTITLPDLGL